MALVFKNRVKETCTAPGIGTVTLLGPVTGFVGFSTIGTTNTTYYTIADQTGNNWEVGLGTWTTGGSYGTLARTTVFSNSLGTTAKIDFSSGTQDVFITGPSERYLVGLTTETGSVSNPSTTTLGYNSLGAENNSVAIGQGAQAFFEGVAVGVGAGAKSASPNGGSIAIGRAANASSPNGISIGANAFINTPGNHSIAIGKSASILYPNSIALTASGAGLSIPNSGVFIDSMRDESAGSPNKTLKYNTTTKEIFYGAAGAGSGTVTNVSVVTANGLGGTVATSTTTPAITLSTSVTGLLQGNGTALSAVTVGSGLSFTSGTLSAPPATPTVSGTVLGNTTSGGLVALGYDAIVTGSNSVAVGTGTNVTGASAVAMGQGVILDYNGSVLIGANAGDTGANAVVIGASSVSGNGSITIGSGIFNNQANSIALSTNGSFTTPNSGVFIDSMRDESAGSPNKTLKYNTTTKEIFYGVGGGGNGTVTDVSVITANGLGGTVATSTTTPAITLTTSVTGVLKGDGTAISAATAGTDYLAPPSGTSILKGNSGGALANAVAGTDYAPATSGTSILKANGTGGFSNAAAGTDYAPATTGTSAQLLANNGTGGFSNVTVGSGLDFTAGTLSAPATSPFPFINPSTVSQNITVTTGNNAMLVGPITVANGFSITVNDGANFVVVT